MSILDSALQAADLGLKIIPLPALAKAPPPKGWREMATTDPTTIAAWFRGNPNGNYGIPSGSANDLFVVDLDGPAAQQWWKSQGLDSGAVVQTPSGPDRTHLYFRTESTEIQTNAGKLHPSVDIRGEDGYSLGPGSMLPTGTYKGSLEKIPLASDELLALIPERQTYSSEEFVGEQVEAASDNELRQIASAITDLEALPKVWHEGAGWHATVYRVACWFARMANTKAYAMTEQGALTILLSSTPVYPGWDESNIVTQWESAVANNAGRYAETPTAAIPNLLSFASISHLIPEKTTTGENFLEALIFKRPDAKVPGHAFRLRQAILVEAFRAGLTSEQSATAAWGANASVDLKMDHTGINTLWSEVEKARATVQAEHRESFGGPVDVTVKEVVPQKEASIGILTAKERAWLLETEPGSATPRFIWWGTRYLDWAATRVTMMNLPYHRMNLWTILSLVFSDSGFIPNLQKRINLALFQMVIGKTTTGKTEAFEIMRSVVMACFPKGESPNIGGDASPEALTHKLIERDGKPSWFNKDEAHGMLGEMGGDSWRRGLREKWTDYYEGRVSMILRNGKTDISGVEARTFFVMYLMGTLDGMMAVLDSEFWTSGFLARFLFTIGWDLEPTEESYEERDQEGDVDKGYDLMPKQWAAEFANSKQRLKALGALPLPIRMDNDARARHVVFKKAIAKMFVGHRQHALIRPTLIRFGINVRKAASLVAMSEGTGSITLRHELIALEQAEEWLGNVVRMVEGTTESHFSRMVTEVEEFVIRSGGLEVTYESIMKHFPGKKRDTEELIAQLLAEGRATKTQMGFDKFALSIKQQEAIAA